MSAAGAHAEKLSEVARMASSLADRILDAQIAQRPIPDDQIGALTRAAALLQDHGAPWPPLVEQVLHEYANKLEAEAPPSKPASEGDDMISRLSRLVGAFRRERAGA